MEDQKESSRVFVAHLPPAFDSDQLRQHFATQFFVTDAHVIAGRRIGFVGLKDTETAQAATKYFNKSFIRMSKISVDIAKAVEVKRDASGRAAPQSMQETRGKKRKREAETRPNAERKPRNEYEIKAASTDTQKLDVNAAAEITDGNKIADQESNTTPHQNAKEVQEVELNQDELHSRSDNDWLHQRKSRLLDLIEPEHLPNDVPGSTEGHVDTADPQSETVIQPEQSNLHEVAKDPRVEVPNARLFVRNLPFEVTEEDLRGVFSSYGKVEDIHLVRDSKTLSSKGIAFVQYVQPEHAEEAIRSLDGQAFQGRLLHILPASEKRTSKLNDFEISKLPLKQQKAVQRKAEASSSTFTWNSLYMNADAVVASVAQRLGVDKAEILDPTSSDAAVKQAHAETSVIVETKDYLLANGVNIEAFKSKHKDDRCILLKNFTFGTSAADLTSMLEPFGSISRFVFPPSGTMAIVEYAEPGAAAQALNQLAYRNIKGVPLYLEKAPADLFKVNNSVAKDHTLESNPDQGSAQHHDGLTYSVFIKNLSFSTSTMRLVEVFKPLAGFLSARVKTKSDAKRPNEVLSMGFGFVEFRSKSEADAAVIAMNGHHLDSHRIQVQVARKALDAADERRQEDKAKKENKGKTRVVLKNLPFQTSKKDIRKLLMEYGKVRTIRLPQKFDNTARGFAFADFVSAKEAENAVEALSNTHILGRRLVLEFAEEENVDPEEHIRAIERKVSQQNNMVQLSKLTGPGRRKFNVDAQEQEQV